VENNLPEECNAQWNDRFIGESTENQLFELTITELSLEI
jgi:hypothetical protein